MSGVNTHDTAETFRPLERYLEHADKIHAVMFTFPQIESILGDDLPPAATASPAFWENNSLRQVHAATWLNAGWKVRSVDLTRRVVVFVPSE
jgi:hypothetical protein